LRQAFPQVADDERLVLDGSGRKLAYRRLRRGWGRFLPSRLAPENHRGLSFHKGGHLIG
jgi:hypothetical protein